MGDQQHGKYLIDKNIPHEGRKDDESRNIWQLNKANKNYNDIVKKRLTYLAAVERSRLTKAVKSPILKPRSLTGFIDLSLKAAFAEHEMLK